MSPRGVQHAAVAGVLAVALTASGAVGLSAPGRHSLPSDVLNPAVTQSTIRSTICVVGWTATIRPSSSVTAPIKIAQITLYGYVDKDPANYEEDHTVALEVGGAPGTRKAHANLWPEPRSVSGPDDGTEATLKNQVCAGTLTLRTAQKRLYAVKVAHGYRHALSAR